MLGEGPGKSEQIGFQRQPSLVAWGLRAVRIDPLPNFGIVNLSQSADMYS